MSLIASYSIWALLVCRWGQSEEIAPVPAQSPVAAKVSSSEVPPPPPRAVSLRAPAFEQEGPRGAFRVDFADLKFDRSFESLADEELMAKLPPEILSLNGQRVRIRGVMFPPPTETGIKSFYMVDYISHISFVVADVAVYRRLAVRMKTGAEASYIESQTKIDVEGKMVIQPRRNSRNESLRFLFLLEEAEVLRLK